MTTIQYLTHATYGCCTSGELLALNRMDKDAVVQLKEWAREEMKKREIPIDEPAKQ